MEFIQANWGSIVAIITGVISIASIIAKLTPNKTDDKVLGCILKVVDVLAINTKPTTIKK
jgi:hypothetical protein